MIAFDEGTATIGPYSNTHFICTPISDGFANDAARAIYETRRRNLEASFAQVRLLALEAVKFCSAITSRLYSPLPRSALPAKFSFYQGVF